MVEELLHCFCCFGCNSLFAIGCVKGCSKHVSSAVTVAKYCNLTPCRFQPFSKHPSFRDCNHVSAQSSPNSCLHPLTLVQVQRCCKADSLVFFWGGEGGGVFNVQNSTPKAPINTRKCSQKSFFLSCFPLICQQPYQKRHLFTPTHTGGAEPRTWFKINSHQSQSMV